MDDKFYSKVPLNETTKLVKDIVSDEPTWFYSTEEGEFVASINEVTIRFNQHRPRNY